MPNKTYGARKQTAVRPLAHVLKSSGAPDDAAGGSQSPEHHVVDSLKSAALLAFTGGSLDAFLYLNHNHVFAGVMTGNAVLCGIAIFAHSAGGAMQYIRPIFAYVCGILLIAVFQRHVRHHSVRFALAIVAVGLLVLSFLPGSFPEQPYVFLVVLLTGFLVGIAPRVDTYSYNATVLTGSLRDAILSLYQALNPAGRANNLRKSRDLWFVMLSFLAETAGGGLLGTHYGNHALWLPVGVIVVVFIMIVAGANNQRSSAA